MIASESSQKPNYPPRLPADRNFRYIEALLYSYPGMKKAIQSLEAQIKEIDNELISAGVAKYGVEGYGGNMSFGNVELTQPERDADRRIEKKRRLVLQIETLRRRQDVIRDAINSLGGKHERVVRVKYLQNWESNNPGGRIWKEMGMRWETYVQVCSEAVESVGRYCGEWAEKTEKKEENGR